MNKKGFIDKTSFTEHVVCTPGGDLFVLIMGPLENKVIQLDAASGTFVGTVHLTGEHRMGTISKVAYDKCSDSLLLVLNDNLLPHEDIFHFSLSWMSKVTDTTDLESPV